MNFLAHIYLSGNDENIIIGNFISDGIKGSKYKKYSPSLQKGILLHRYIDSFTDNHPIVRKSKSRLQQKFGHYSGVIIDIFYDHFLAKNWAKYHSQTLTEFVDYFYKMLRSNFGVLPKKIKRLYPDMVADNWLLTYRSVEGIGIILEKMGKRIDIKPELKFAVIDLETHYADFEEEFTVFFEELRAYSKDKLLEL